MATDTAVDTGALGALAVGEGREIHVDMDLCMGGILVKVPIGLGLRW